MFANHLGCLNIARGPKVRRQEAFRAAVCVSLTIQQASLISFRTPRAQRHFPEGRKFADEGHSAISDRGPITWNRRRSSTLLSHYSPSRRPNRLARSLKERCERDCSKGDRGMMIATVTRVCNWIARHCCQHDEIRRAGAGRLWMECRTCGRTSPGITVRRDVAHLVKCRTPQVAGSCY